MRGRVSWVGGVIVGLIVGVVPGSAEGPVPLTGFAANFSPIPRIAPPPLGSETEGAGKLSLPIDGSLPGGTIVIVLR